MPTLLGFRANTLTFDADRKLRFFSPAHHDFGWSERVVWAECLRCPKNANGHVDIQEDCECGIHATLDPSELEYYSNRYGSTNIPMLVEALDNAWMHEQGITASGVAVVAVIHYPNHGMRNAIDRDWDVRIEYGKKELALGIAAKWFDVPVIDYETAVYMAEIKWNEYGQGEPPFPYHLYLDLFHLTYPGDHSKDVWVPNKGKGV